VIRSGIICKQLIERDFLENVHAQDLQYTGQTFVDSMDLIETGHHEVNTDGDPDLGAHGVFGSAEEGFDSQVLLDPFEEEFDLPAASVDRCDGQSRKLEVVGQENQSLSGSGIEVTDTPQPFRIVEFSFPGAQSNRLVAAQSCCLVDRSGLQHVESRVAFGSNHEECLALVDAEQTGEVEIATVDHIDAARFESDLVEKVDIVNRSVRDTYKHWDRAGQVELSVQFDGCFGAPEMCPWKHRQAKVDGRGIDRVNHLVDIQPVGVFGIQSSCLANENLSERFVNAPVPMLVGVGQVGPRDVPANAHCVEMGATAKAGFDVPQALPEGDLSKGHCEKLIADRHTFAGPVHRVQSHAAVELLSVNKIGDLRENQASGVHSLLRMNSGIHRQPAQMRHMPFSSLAV